MTDRNKPSAGFWITVVLVVVLVYVGSVGPAFLACSDSRGRIRDDWTGAAYLRIYDPIIWTLQKGPKPASEVLCWYLSLWGAP